MIAPPAVTLTLPVLLETVVRLIALASVTVRSPPPAASRLATLVFSEIEPVASAVNRSPVTRPVPAMLPLVALSVTSSPAVVVPSSWIDVPFRLTSPIVAVTLVLTVIAPPAVTLTLPVKLETVVRLIALASVTVRSAGPSIAGPPLAASRLFTLVFSEIEPVASAVNRSPDTRPVPAMLPLVALSVTSSPAVVVPSNWIDVPLRLTSPVVAVTLALTVIAPPAVTLTLPVLLETVVRLIALASVTVRSPPLAAASILKSLAAFVSVIAPLAEAMSAVPGTVRLPFWVIEPLASTVRLLPMVSPERLMPADVAFSVTLSPLVVPFSRSIDVPWSDTFVLASTCVTVIASPAVTLTLEFVLVTFTSVTAFVSAIVIEPFAIAVRFEAAVVAVIEPVLAFSTRSVALVSPEPVIEPPELLSVSEPEPE